MEYPFLDENNKIILETISIAQKQCKLPENEIQEKIDEFLNLQINKQKNTRQRIVDVITDATSVEELANIWKYIIKKQKNLKYPTDYYLNIIYQKLQDTPIFNPFFYEEEFDMDDEDAEEKLQFDLCRIQYILKKIKLNNLNSKIHFYNYPSIQKEFYLKNILAYVIKNLAIYVITYNLIDKKNTIFHLCSALNEFNFLAYDIKIQDLVYSIITNASLNKNASLNNFIAPYKKNLGQLDKEITPNSPKFAEEISIALEHNSPLHYAIAYNLINKDIYFDTIPDGNAILEYTKNKLRTGPFNNYEYILLSQLMYESERDKEKINTILIALTTALDNNNLENIEYYHLQFYDNLFSVIGPNITADTLEKIEELFLKYKYTYSKHTITYFENYIKEDLKR